MFNSYITHSKDFAQPILLYLQETIHKACPEVEEAIKWSFPHFLYKGKILCNMAAFKEHCAFGFWYARSMKDPNKIFLPGKEHSGSSMGHLGKIKTVEDLPSEKILIKYIKEAMALIDAGIVLPSKTQEKRLDPTPVPSVIQKILNKNLTAKTFFNTLSPSQQKEYILWILEAKQESTQERRLLQMVQMLSEGKTRNWKYEKRK